MVAIVEIEIAVAVVVVVVVVVVEGGATKTGNRRKFCEMTKSNEAAKHSGQQLIVSSYSSDYSTNSTSCYNSN